MAGSSGNEFWKVELSRSGEPTAFLNGRALHSRFNPRKEALRAAESVSPGAAIVVLGGLGLGYVAEALLEKHRNIRLIIAEADPALPSLAAEARKLDVRATVEETRRRRAVNARTLERFGPLWVRNLAANVPAMLRGIALAPWENAFDGIPALILAGGPSLDDLLPHLEALHSRFLLIAVDTAAGALFHRGVLPDIIAAVDPQYWNTRHLDVCERYGAGSENILILAESATHPAVFRRLPGRPWLTRTRFPLGSLLEDAAGIEGELRAGGSVATAAWDLARFLGCSHLIAGGLDLGFPGRKTHYSGSLARMRPLMYSCRTAPAEDAFFHALHDAPSRKEASARGGTVMTDARMDIYAAWFGESAGKIPEKQPALLGGAGRAVPGMAVMEVEQLRAFPECRRKIEPLLAEIRNTPPAPERAPGLLQALSSIHRALQDLEQNATRAAKLAQQANEHMHQTGRPPQELIRRLDRIDKDILSGDGRDVVSFLIQPIILEIQSSSGQNSENPLETSLRLYRQIAESAAYHARYLGRAARNLVQ